MPIRNRCCTTDRLTRRGLPHPSHCPFCDQEEENIQHLLTTCVLARDFWYPILSVLGLQDWVPSSHEISFADWWHKATKKLSKGMKKGLNTVIFQGAWILWKHRNACVFDRAAPRISRLLQAFKEEEKLWCLVGAWGLQTLSLGHGLG